MGMRTEMRMSMHRHKRAWTFTLLEAFSGCGGGTFEELQ